MRNSRLISWRLLGSGLAILTIGSALSLVSLYAQKADESAGTPVKMIVTAEARRGQDVPPISREDVVVREGSNRDPVTGWIPLKGDQAGMDLFILLDDGSDTYLGLQFDSIRNFINTQPSTTRIAVGYMRNGTVQIEQDFTAEHAAAARALRLPMGSPGNNPYFSLIEILLISDGVDPGERFPDPYLDSTIEQAQRDRILVYTLYAASEGSYGHNLQRITAGQNNLSRLAAETGAEAYFQGFHTPISFAPFLADMSAQLNHQYLLTFTAEPKKKDGFREVRLETEVSNAELNTANRVYVPAP
jgi:hypothetical protein